MPIHSQHVVRFAKPDVEQGARRLAEEGASLAAASGGKLFGVFRPVIGMSQSAVVVIAEWPSEALARAQSGKLADLAAAELLEQDLWEPTARPLPGEVPAETSGFYSHRAFDIRAESWPRFLELSTGAWGNWEGTHAAAVKGFWKARKPPGPGLLRVRLMAWYESLDAWERSRYWSGRAKPGSDAAFDRFRERAMLTEDTHVSMLARVG
jgi:hypothetical protein